MKSTKRTWTEPAEPKFVSEARKAFYECENKNGANSEEALALNLAYNAAYSLERALKNAITLRDKMARVVEQIERANAASAIEYLGLNSLGEVQGLGLDVDREIALYCDRAEQARLQRDRVERNKTQAAIAASKEAK